jgi:hypothetical protein
MRHFFLSSLIVLPFTGLRQHFPRVLFIALRFCFTTWRLLLPHFISGYGQVLLLQPAQALVRPEMAAGSKALFVTHAENNYSHYRVKSETGKRELVIMGNKNKLSGL